MLAYSSIAHAGYMLIGIAVAFWDSTNRPLSLEQGFGLPGGAKASLLYLLVYSLASVGMFSVLVYLARKGRQVEHVDELTGLGRTQPLVAIAAAIFLFSMTGIPPLAGFWGKLAVFSSALSVRTGPNALHVSFVVLAVIGVLNAAIAAVYYLRIVAVMYLNDPVGHTPEPEGGRGAYAAVLASAALVLLVGLAPSPVFRYLASLEFKRPNLGFPTAHVDAPRM
jgi:NADH-quinone oxidoreductase subunit N